MHSHWIATSINKTQKIVSLDVRAKLKKINTTILCSSKQNNQELNVINHKSNFSTIKLNNCSFLYFKILFTCKTHESKYQQKLQQTPCIIWTQQHNKTQQSYGVFQIQKIGFWSQIVSFILNTKKLESRWH
jgi:hypothetical protein